MPEALFEIRGLTKKYGSRTVLDGLDFDILQGRVPGDPRPLGHAARA